jgi:hypothetical protein
MHRNPYDLHPTLDSTNELRVIITGLEHESLLDLALAASDLLLESDLHEFSYGKEPPIEFKKTESSIFDLRTAAAITLEQRGVNGQKLALIGVKRAASRILTESKDCLPNS